MELNNGYQNLYLHGLDISVGGSVEGLKEQIRDILPNKVAIVSGVAVGSEKKLPIGVEVKKYITYTEEPEDWDEEEQGEFIPEEVCNLEIRNLYGYDLTIVDDVVSSAKTSVVSVADIEAGTIENAKPIYVHPLDIRGDNFSICCFVFNNDPEPLTKDSFVDWMDSLFEVVGDAIRVLASGGCNAGGSVYPAIFVIRRASTDPNLFGINFRTESGNANINFTDSATFKAGITVFNDGVNKIN